MDLRQKRVLFYTLYFIQIVFIASVFVLNSKSQILAGSGIAMIAFGGFFGLMAGFFFLHQMILISGASFFERYFGLDRLARIHHVTGLVGYGFLVAHILFIISGYSIVSGNGFVAQYFQLKDSFSYIALASISLILLDIVIITSIVIVRKRLKYELWYFVHLLVYAAVLLALFHQVTNGQNLLSSPALRAYWYLLYITAFGLVLWRRWLLPVYYEFKHRFRVKKVVKENDSVVSIYIKGKNLQNFKYEPGQFNLWQFWQSGVRGMHHPFTISSTPGDGYLRLTAKMIGDYTKKLPRLEEGALVLISGPYGIFTSKSAVKTKRLFIAGGIGITPIASMLRQKVNNDDVLIYAAQTSDDAVFLSEFEKLKSKGLKIVKIFSKEESKDSYSGYLSPSILVNEVPDVTERDVWLCGPPAMMDAAQDLLLSQAVDQSQIHTERFRL